MLDNDLIKFLKKFSFKSKLGIKLGTNFKFNICSSLLFFVVKGHKNVTGNC